MNLFFDTEFTRLNDPSAELISIGIVDEGRRHTFYAELEHDRTKASQFVIEHVYPKLQGIEKPAVEVNKRLMEWLEKIRNGENVNFCCDYSEDERLLEWLFGGTLPEWMEISNIGGITNRYFDHRKAFARPDPKAHHALHDAYELRQKYIKAI